MSRHFPPPRFIARWFLATILTILPLAGHAEVTLTTSVERISSAVSLTADEATPVAAPVTAPGASTDASMASPVDSSSEPVPAGPPSEVFSGDVLRYTIVFENRSTQDVAAGSVVITNPLPEETFYLDGSAMGDDTLISYSVDGETFAGPAELLQAIFPCGSITGAPKIRAMELINQVEREGSHCQRLPGHPLDLRAAAARRRILRGQLRAADTVASAPCMP